MRFFLIQWGHDRYRSTLMHPQAIQKDLRKLLRTDPRQFDFEEDFHKTLEDVETEWAVIWSFDEKRFQQLYSWTPPWWNDDHRTRRAKLAGHRWERVDMTFNIDDPENWIEEC